MPVIKTKTTYLEMLSPPETVLDPPRPDLETSRLVRPSVEFYRYLYRSVGKEFCWVDRLVMPEDELRVIIQDDHVEVLVLTIAGQTGGYAELDRRVPGEIELAYFGLFPAAIGQGLGKYLLNCTLRRAWSHAPRRVWVHTCDLDHPAALPNYVRAGFQIYDERIVDQWVS